MIKLLPNMTNEGSEGHIGWFENRQRVLRGFIERLRPIKLVEIGFNMGHSCKLICDTIIDLKNNDADYSQKYIDFYIFDTFPHKWSLPNFMALKDYYKDKGIWLYAIQGSTVDTLEPFFSAYNYFDFIEIDGSHDIEIALSDILNVYDWVRKGGGIYIDDYTPTDENNVVVKAVDSVDWIEYNIDNGNDIFLGIKK